MCGRAQGGKSSVAELQLQRSPEICRVRMKQTGAPLPLPRPLSTKEEGVLHGEGTNLRTRRRPSSSPLSPLPSTRTAGHGQTPGIPNMPVYARESACSDPGGRREPHAYRRASRHDSPRAPELNEACSAGVGHEGWGEGATRVQRRAFAPKREILSSTFRAPFYSSDSRSLPMLTS